MLAAVHHGEVRGVYANFRNGDLILNNMDDAHRVLDKISELGEITSAFYNQKMVRAVTRIFDIEGYDHERMVAKVSANPQKVTVFQGVEDNLRLLEDIYNDYLRNNRLRFF